ncbi:fluoride efflux transporter CrcB [uncultured Flavobacterium sp.]|uniref:fluoride efflux transporter CrcB n=1 Tax=uncultured Flavobacterium sp. TaxID=165435 RepID=UPI0030EDFF0C|tara:strand:+ start:33517 stop:33888 length:372 start_codon:yes stop_codon:yes gene_type:complete
MLKNLFLVAIGGASGSVLRYLVHWIISKKSISNFPYQTFIVNIIGCLLIGILVGYLAKNSSQNETLKLLLITGFCGGFTTFSAFGLENINMIQNQNYQLAFIYTSLSLVLGVLAVSLGIFISK